MDIGISTGLFYREDIFSCLKPIKDSGFNIIEVWTAPSQDGKYIHFDWHNFNILENLKSTIDLLNLKVISVHSPFSDKIDTYDISNLDEAKRQAAVSEIKKVADVLKYLHGEILVIHVCSKEFNLKDTKKKEIYIEQVKKSFKEIFDYAQTIGIKIAVENSLPHILGGEVLLLQELLDIYPNDQFGICLDTSHANLWKEPSLQQIMRSLGSRIIALHISDNCGTYDDHFVLGEGIINWQVVIETLNEINYNSVFMLEVLASKRKLSPKEILQETHHVAKQLLNYAK